MGGVGAVGPGKERQPHQQGVEKEGAHSIKRGVGLAVEEGLDRRKAEVEAIRGRELREGMKGGS